MVKAGERNELGLKHQENGRGHTGFRQHPPQQLAFLVIQRVQWVIVGAQAPRSWTWSYFVVRVLICLAASFPLCACWLLYVCLVALSVNQQIVVMPRLLSELGSRHPAPPSPLRCLVLAAGQWARRGFTRRAFWARFIPHLSSPPCACSAAAQCSSGLDLFMFWGCVSALCSSAQVHWLRLFISCFQGSFSLCLGCFLTALLPQQHRFTTPHSVYFWRVFNAGQQKKANSNETAKLIAKFLLASSPRVTDRERSSVGLQARVLAGGHSTIFEPTVTCCCTLMK